ncbi:uncharacterized protein LOC111343660 [Stylophora pistillata]|uniref:uncharacterized protein LOC111343660 n=1 Tax=Stylophora pistillata TaxID=50429 RepID=UPI000C056346|nr:uncharacterized protein LOC111343660 [Stylophora pistillata]
MKWHRVRTLLSRKNLNSGGRKRKGDLEHELCKRIKTINKYEEELLQDWDTLEEFDSIHERKIQIWIEVKERHDKAARDRQILMDEIKRLEIELKRALVKRMKSLRERIQVTWRVLQLTKKKTAIERNSVMFLDMKACHDQHKEKQEWRENLRRTRSQSDIPRNAQYKNILFFSGL